MTISGQYCWKWPAGFCRVAGGKPAVAWQCVRATARYFSGITVVTFALSTARTAWRTNGIAGITQEREWPDSGDGATGSGKSTTLAAMVGYLNQHADAHILTLEDPVEYIYASQRCLIQQREIGLHCMTFASGLRAALREDPDVILLGELRDSETIRLALTAAETGHLVLATLHTRGAAQAVERLVDSFPAQEKIPYVINWQVVYGPCCHKSWKWINRKDAWRCLNY